MNVVDTKLLGKLEMARGSLGKKVARAAATGGGRTYKGARPWGFYSVVGVLSILGIVGIIYSRSEMIQKAVNATSTSTIPASAQPIQGVNWKEAIGFDICGKFEPNLPASPNATTIGITANGLGLITISPKSKAEEGKNATLGYFVSHYPGLSLTSSSITYPGVGTFKNGVACSGSKTPSYVQVVSFSSILDKKGSVIANPTSLKLVNSGLITVGFVPKGTQISQPPSASQLEVATPPSSTTTVPSLSTSPSTLPINNTSTSATISSPNSSVASVTTTTSKTGSTSTTSSNSSKG